MPGNAAEKPVPVAELLGESVRSHRGKRTFGGKCTNCAPTRESRSEDNQGMYSWYMDTYMPMMPTKKSTIMRIFAHRKHMHCVAHTMWMVTEDIWSVWRQFTCLPPNRRSVEWLGVKSKSCLP